MHRFVLRAIPLLIAGFTTVQLADLLARRARTIALITGGAMFVVGFALVMLAVWETRRMKTRISAGRCPACGYDLRATPDRCPECGHSV
jgi:hypothetical protein